MNGQTLKGQLASLQEKARQRTVKTQNIEYDLETLVKKLKKGVIKLDPEYQRKHRWLPETSSRLIESLILNIPVPIVYLSQDIDVDIDANEEDARYSVIDGQQRLTAIQQFFENKLILSGLTSLKELNSCSYKDLPPFLVRRLEERTLKCLRIDSTVDPQVKYDIFERLNSGSVKLTAQELRNAISRGKFNEIIKQLATSITFRKLVQINHLKPELSNKVKKMEDIELVLRFYVLFENYPTRFNNLKKGFGPFLSEEMDKLNEKVASMDAAELDRYKMIFINTIEYVYSEFGNIAFAKYTFEDEQFRRMSNFNASVFDALSIAVAHNRTFDKKKRKVNLAEQFQLLFADQSFFDAVSGSVNDKDKLLTRIDAAIRVVK